MTTPTPESTPSEPPTVLGVGSSSPDMVSIIAKVIADNSVAIHEHPDYGELTASTLTPDQMARAVLAAISEAGNVEWGVKYGAVFPYESEDEARRQLNFAQMDVPATLVNRIKAGPWTAVEG